MAKKKIPIEKIKEALQTIADACNEESGGTILSVDSIKFVIKKTAPKSTKNNLLTDLTAHSSKVCYPLPNGGFRCI